MSQAQRKIADPASARVAAPGEGVDWAPSGSVSDQSSPAHLMLRDLASRLTPPATALPASVERKWPMPARIGAIVGLSLVGWGVLGWVALKLF